MNPKSYNNNNRHGGHSHRAGSSSGRRPFRGGNSGGGHFRGNRGGRGGGRSFSKHIDVSKFINKAVITEQVDHFVPEHGFSDFHIDEKLKNIIAERKFSTPTPIQDKGIPHILRGSDIVGIANTGTGKTAAFLIPLINKVLIDRTQNILIVVPTRELAQQIDVELKAFSKNMGIFSVCCVGGGNMGSQMRALRYHNNFIIGTPGRLKDFIDRKLIDLSKFKTIVMDEADRMLDMGFVNDMKMLISKMPKDRHTLFFSATISSDIEKLIKDFLNQPVRISVKTGDTAKSVDQDVIRVGGKDKMDILHDLLLQKEFSKVLIFGKTKHGVERLSKTLAEKGFKAESIHGDKPQGKRQKALGLFKQNHIQILVATDVAARGLDIADVTHVINYDIPATYEDYVHRIGRTGRGGKKGKALTFV